MGKKHLQLAILNAIHQQSGTDTGHRSGYSFTIFLNVRLIRSPTFSLVFGTSCFQNCCIVPAMMMSVPLLTENVFVSLVMLCRIRNCPGRSQGKGTDHVAHLRLVIGVPSHAV